MNILPELPLDKPTQPHALSSDEVLNGPYVAPIDRIRLYSDAEFERMIQEWAYHYVQRISGEYVRVARLGGSGDLGRDVIGYCSDPPQARTFDVYQCKHYIGPIAPDDFWPELGKLCYHTFTNSILIPRKYYLVAPQDLGPKLHQLIDDPTALRANLLAVWDKKCAPLFNSPVGAKLDGPLRAYIGAFDFGVVTHKPILEVIEVLRKTICYSPRFGGGLQLPPLIDPQPPSAIAANESRYAEQLIAAYRDKLDDPSLSISSLSEPVHQQLSRHFVRSRERFYCAEYLQHVTRDALAGGPVFRDVQDQVFDAVVDTAESDHPNGFDRVVAVTSLATSVSVTNHPLKSFLKAKSLMGVCHQLANIDELKWVP